ncbi:MAG: 5'-methylthioadenosine/adenosylhomocysteine nucleosidase [Clostridia bacterium]
MKIGIIAAMETEIKILKNALDNVKIEKHAGIDVFSGKLLNLDVVLSTCGIGKVNAAVHTQSMVDNYGIDMLIHTGVAGGLDERLKRLDLVVAERLTYHDFCDEFKTTCFPYQDFFYSDRELLEMVLENGNGEIYTGTVVSGDQFINDSAIKTMLSKKYNAMCVEMEGAAIAHTAYLNSIPFVVLRCISDMADDNADKSFLEFEEVAGQRAANVVLNMLKSISLKNQ